MLPDGKKLGVKNTVARVRTMEYYRQMVFPKDELSLSLVFNSERSTAGEISRILRFPSAEKVTSFAKGRAEMVKFTIGGQTPLVGLALNRFHQKFGSGILVSAVKHARRKARGLSDAHADFLFGLAEIIKFDQ